MSPPNSSRCNDKTASAVETAEAATFADALDGLRAGLFLVDATGRIVHANLSGHAILQQRTVCVRQQAHWSPAERTQRGC